MKSHLNRIPDRSLRQWAGGRENSLYSFAGQIYRTAFHNSFSEQLFR